MPPKAAKKKPPKTVKKKPQKEVKKKPSKTVVKKPKTKEEVEKTANEKPKRKYTKRKQTKVAVNSSSENEDSTVSTTTIEKVPQIPHNNTTEITGTDKKPFKCGLPSCDKVFSKQTDLYQHISNADHDLKPEQQQQLKARPLSKEEAKRYVIVLSDVLDREYQALGIKKYCKGDVYGGDDANRSDEVDEKPNGSFGGRSAAAAGNGSTAQPPIMPYFTTIRQTAAGLFQCPFWKCEHLSKDRFVLKQHYRVHCGREYRPYLCAFNRATCRYASNQKSAVEMHLRVQHFGLPATKKKHKMKTATVLAGGGGRGGGKGNASKNKQNSGSGGGGGSCEQLPTPMGIISLNSAGQEIETEEEPLAVIGTTAGGDDKKVATLEVDVGRYVETVTEWLKMEDELFDRARLISDLPAGAKVEKPRPYVCPNASTGCPYTATSTTNLKRHLQSVHKPPPEVVQIE
ncbi:hypothetical protein TYRP_012139 [Tyrophagus putrescentiae]|nr:hypothetical protein TYRP_012139 [Tyrophagus putrescentiae]